MFLQQQFLSLAFIRDSKMYTQIMLCLQFYIVFITLKFVCCFREYVRGAKVRLRINELELSSKFLGANKEITLREADGILLGIIRTPLRKST